MNSIINIAIFWSLFVLYFLGSLLNGVQIVGAHSSRDMSTLILHRLSKQPTRSPLLAQLYCNRNPFPPCVRHGRRSTPIKTPVVLTAATNASTGRFGPREFCGLRLYSLTTQYIIGPFREKLSYTSKGRILKRVLFKSNFSFAKQKMKRDRI